MSVQTKFKKKCLFINKEVKVKKRKEEQGQIHGYPSRVRVGRSSAGEGHQGTWAGAVSSKSSKTPNK